jgi:sensor c-di-GMP phosphodiesterase-like protein
VPEHLDNDDLYVLLKGIVESGELQQHRISLEITERLPISDLVAARQMLDKIYALGIDLKLDDAGTGYGGFSYVQNLGISTLKIDKMFVDTIGHEDNFNAKTIDAIISFAQKSDLSMIAEGVEDDKQVAYLSAHGVYLIQGYIYSKPLPAKQFFQ